MCREDDADLTHRLKNSNTFAFKVIALKYESNREGEKE
jgi:hypothetical protein